VGGAEVVEVRGAVVAELQHGVVPRYGRVLERYVAAAAGRRYGLGPACCAHYSGAEARDTRREAADGEE
jgi:hypothetical protein